MEMETRTSPSGYTYHVPKKEEKAPIPMKKRPKLSLRDVGYWLLHDLPYYLFQVVRYAILTPVMITLFVINFVKSLLGVLISWIVFKFTVSFIVALLFETYTYLTKQPIAENYNKFLNDMMKYFVLPQGAPIHYGWEIAIIVAGALLVAFMLTFKPEELD